MLNFHCCPSLPTPPLLYLFFFYSLKGQILANLKAMDSDWFSQNYIKRKEKVQYGTVIHVERERKKGIVLGGNMWSLMCIAQEYKYIFKA